MSMLVLAAPRTQEAVTLTSSADFNRGVNEGLISTAQDRLTRGRLSVGDIGAWSSSGALPVARSYVDAVSYNGFAYATGGRGPGLMYHFYLYSSVYVASLNADGSLTWSSTTPFSG